RHRSTRSSGWSSRSTCSSCESWPTTATSPGSPARPRRLLGLEVAQELPQLVGGAGGHDVALLVPDLRPLVPHRLEGELGVVDAGGQPDEEPGHHAAAGGVDITRYVAVLVGQPG